MYIGSTVDFSSTDSAILRADLSLENSKILRTRQYNENELYQPINFVGSFEHGEFIYFIFREISIEDVSLIGTRKIVSRIARVCKNDQGGIHFGRDNWSSFKKARLNCSLPGKNPFYFDEVQDISYLAEDEELYAVFTTPENSIHGSAICIFNMSSIAKAFSGPLKYQDNVQGSTIWKIKQQEETFSCKSPSQRDSQSILNSPRYQLMELAVQPMHLNPLYVEKLEIFTRISVLKLATKLHEKVTLIFVASLEYIKKISILPRTKESCLIEILELEKGINKIEILKYLRASDSLYVGKFLVSKKKKKFFYSFFKFIFKQVPLILSIKFLFKDVQDINQKFHVSIQTTQVVVGMICNKSVIQLLTMTHLYHIFIKMLQFARSYQHLLMVKLKLIHN